jgi:glycosyltransferase involved in cell wall biosynthesis
MKVLHLIASMDPEAGGVSQAVSTIVLSLDNGGIMNEVVSLDQPDAPFLNNKSVIMHGMGTGKGVWGYSPLLNSWLISNLPRFDAVIVHGLWQYHSYSLRKAISSLKKMTGTNPYLKVPRTLIMPHGMLDPYFQRAKGRKLKAIRNWVYWKMIEGYVINEADGVLFTCDEEKRLAKEPFHPYKPKKEIVVGLGVISPPAYSTTMEEAFLKKCPQVRNNKYFLFLSRLHEKKGVDMLIEAYKNLYTKTTNKDSLPKLVIAGPGTETNYGSKLIKSVNEAEGLNSFILFPGMLVGDAKWGAFYNCETFILPSHQENFGIAVVEALACEKAVLISNQVNIFKEIKDNQAGIVSEDTVEGTLGSLQRWNDLLPHLRKLMERMAKQTYEDKFSLESFSGNFKKALN